MLFKDGQQIIVKENGNETRFLVVYSEQLVKFILIPCCSVQQLYEKHNKNNNWNFDCNDYIAVINSEINCYLDFKNTIIVKDNNLSIFNKTIAIIDNKVWYSAKKNSIIEQFITSESYTNVLQRGIEFHNVNINPDVEL